MLPDIGNFSSFVLLLSSFLTIIWLKKNWLKILMGFILPGIIILSWVLGWLQYSITLPIWTLLLGFILLAALIRLFILALNKKPSAEEKLVLEILLENDPVKIAKLLDHQLKVLKEKLSLKTKEIIINYIYDTWRLDTSWSGTIRPMKWFDTYFEFFTRKQSRYFLDILEELTSANPSYDALQFTQSIANKLTPKLLSPIEVDFVRLCARRVISYPKDRTEYLFKNLEKLVASGLIKHKNTHLLSRKIIQAVKYQQQGNTKEYLALEEEIFRKIVQ
ncbi:MAG: hypothetical protein HGB11_09515 [Chlorobiales bacterium]|nr:hypothetical protein [Chlorobiales bacterium]